MAEQDASGYIHDVSEIKVAAKSGIRYFDFKIQQDASEARVVCFSPNKRDDLKEREKRKSLTRLVKVSPQKRKYSDGT